MPQDVAVVAKDGLPITGTIGGDKFLKVVKIYKHMGSRTMSSGAILPEIMTRSRSSNSTLEPLRSKFFKDSFR